jgi:DNA-directed RNA polymerase specialized sigma24 family protein
LSQESPVTETSENLLERFKRLHVGPAKDAAAKALWDLVEADRAKYIDSLEYGNNHISKEDAEELMSEIFRRFYNTLERDVEIQSLPAYAQTIAQNVARDWYAQKVAENQHSPAEIEFEWNESADNSHTKSPEQLWEEFQDMIAEKAEAGRFLMRVIPNSRDLNIYLLAADGMDRESIARKYSLTIDAVAKVLLRCRTRVREALEKEGK